MCGYGFTTNENANLLVDSQEYLLVHLVEDIALVGLFSYQRMVSGRRIYENTYSFCKTKDKTWRKHVIGLPFTKKLRMIYVLDW